MIMEETYKAPSTVKRSPTLLSKSKIDVELEGKGEDTEGEGEDIEGKKEG
jgi:hypothetical protein